MDIVIINRVLAAILIVSAMIMVLKIKKVCDDIASLKEQTLIDPLTQNKNDRAFQKELDLEIQRNKRYQRNLTIGLFNLDGFKSLHYRADKEKANTIIKEISESLDKLTRNTDILYRIQENQFAVIFTETSLAQAKEVCENVHRNITSQLKTHNYPIVIHAGLTSFKLKDTVYSICLRASNALAIAQNNHQPVASSPELPATKKTEVPAILAKSR